MPRPRHGDLRQGVQVRFHEQTWTTSADCLEVAHVAICDICTMRWVFCGETKKWSCCAIWSLQGPMGWLWYDQEHSGESEIGERERTSRRHVLGSRSWQLHGDVSRGKLAPVAQNSEQSSQKRSPLRQSPTLIELNRTQCDLSRGEVRARATGDHVHSDAIVLCI